jgi:Thioesterase-like superfamily
VSDFEELLVVLDLKRVADDRFIGTHPSKNPMRTFGGLLVAQSFVASSRTLTRDDIPPSALSVHFINGGDTAKDIEFHVVRLRDERRFANRRVDAVQDGKVLSSAMISYMSGGRGLEHAVDPPQVPEPHTLPPIAELLRGYEQTVPHFVNALQPIEWRYTNDPAWVMRDKGDRLAYNRVWLKALGPMIPCCTPRPCCIPRIPPCWTRSSPRTGCLGASTAFSRHPPTTRYGSTGRSISATGCCIRRRRRWPRTRAGWVPGISSIARGNSSPP